MLIRKENKIVRIAKSSIVNEEEDIFDFPEQDYSIISVRHIEEPTRVCDRCGKPITNIVRVKGKDGKIYYLGINCAEVVNAHGIDECVEKQ